MKLFFMKYLFKFFILLFFFSFQFAQAQELERPDFDKKLSWIKEKIEAINKYAEYVNLGFEYDLETGICTYIYAQNLYGNRETLEQRYTFDLADIQSVKITQDGVLLTTEGELPFIQMEEINRYYDPPRSNYEKVSELLILANTDPKRLEVVFEESIALEKSK